MFRRILVSGGYGFLGQYLIKDIANEFPNVALKILDINPNTETLLNFYHNYNITVSNNDICDYDSIENEFMDIDLVIHLAGFISYSLRDKELLERSNILGTKNILKAISCNKIKNLIHISSVAALGYNDDNNEPINETYNYDWNIAKKRKKYYMLTKHLADIEIENYIEKGLNTVILYPGLMFGPGDFANSSRIIRAIKYRKIPFNMPGGSNVIDVRDVSKGILTVLKQGITNGKFLLSGHNLTYKEINKIIANKLMVKYPRLTLPRFLTPILVNTFLFIESISKNKLEVAADNIDSASNFRYYDNTKAKKELGWEPEFTFEQTIEDTIKWMNENGLFEK